MIEERWTPEGTFWTCEAPRTLWDILNASTATPNSGVAEDFSCFIRLYIVTSQHPTEISRMDARRLGLENRRWEIPREFKVCRHRIPLSPLAVPPTESALAIRRGVQCDTIFPSADIVSKRLRQGATRLSCGDLRLNDIRHSARCLLRNSPLEFPDHAVRSVLGHRWRITPKGFAPVFGIDEKRRVLRAWQDRPGEITGDDRLKEK